VDTAEEDGDHPATFYQELRLILGEVPAPTDETSASTSPSGIRGRPYKLITLERAKVVIESFIAENM